MEADLNARQVHGQGSGVSVKYFFMLARDRTLIKPGRVVLGYLSRVLGRAVDPEEALALVREAAAAFTVSYPGHLCPRPRLRDLVQRAPPVNASVVSEA